MLDENTVSAPSASQRTQTPLDLLWVWVSATFTGASLPVGYFLADLPPPVALMMIGVASLAFAMDAIIGVFGARYGVPTLILSESIFGKTNLLVAMASYLTQIGWQTICLALITYILQDITALSLYVSFLLAIAFNFIIPILGYRVISQTERVTSGLLIGLSLLLIYFYVTLVGGPTAAFPPIHTRYLLNGLEITFMAAPIAWTVVAADYSRYMKPSIKGLHTARAIGVGSLVGNSLIMGLGYILFAQSYITYSSAGLITSSSLFGSRSLMLLLLTLLLVGLLSANFLTAYSSAIAASVILKRPVKRSVLTLSNSMVVIAITLYILYHHHLMVTFQEFLSLTIMIFAPWSGMVVGTLVKCLLRAPLRYEAFVAAFPTHRNALFLLFGILLTGLGSADAFFVGPLARLLDHSDVAPFIGLFYGFLISLSGFSEPRRVVQA